MPGAATPDIQYWSLVLGREHGKEAARIHDGDVAVPSQEEHEGSVTPGVDEPPLQAPSTEKAADELVRVRQRPKYAAGGSDR